MLLTLHKGQAMDLNTHNIQCSTTLTTTLHPVTHQMDHLLCQQVDPLPCPDNIPACLLQSRAGLDQCQTGTDMSLCLLGWSSSERETKNGHPNWLPLMRIRGC